MPDKHLQLHYRRATGEEPLIYKLYRRKHDTVTGEDCGAHVPELPVEGGGRRRVVWHKGVRELWTCQDPTRFPGVGVGRSKKDARASLRALLALEGNPRPLSRRATRRLRHAMENPTVLKTSPLKVVERDA